VPRSELWNLYCNALGSEANGDHFTRLLADLENDFYICYCPDDDSYTFACKILRDGWQRYHAL